MTMQELFEKVEDLRSEKEVEITLSYLEIYNETIRDLLNAGSGGKQGLMLREDAQHAVSVAGLSSHKPENVQEVMDMVIRGNAARTQSPTEANATSSRSHAVLQVNISLKDRDSSTSEPVTMATLSIIDLAGSERASATKNRGERLLEGANINKSLLALGSCINALCDPKIKNHVPYRNSKLTRLLKFSLGGNCRTVMIVCVSPSSAHFDETQNTLRYANRAKNIQTKSVRNVYNVDRHVKDYLKKIDEQMSRINELTAQQKVYEEMAFAKFRKAETKRSEAVRDGVARIRAAYENSAEERRERLGSVKRLRMLERRIGAISGWVGGFDRVCEAREEEEAPVSLLAMRKTAQGILVELEGSRQHYHQRLARSTWTRAIDTALQDGLRQIQSLDGASIEGSEESSLRKEVESLKSRTENEINLAVLEQEKASESGLMQVLLAAHFETIAILNQILQMSEEDAVQAAREVLGKVLLSCTEATGQIIKPDGGLQITEAVPPTKSGTPRKRKQVPLAGPSPLKNKIRPSIAGNVVSSVPAHMLAEANEDASSRLSSSSPAKAIGSPRRRVKVVGARKGVAFSGTPKKKSSPAKKRAVRWRDDAEEGNLVEFQATPKGFESTPEGEIEATADQLSAVPALPTVLDDGEENSSPLLSLPAPSSEIRKAGNGRFAAGFLSSKKTEGSPTMVPPTLSMGMSSEDDTSPLRDISANSAPSRYSTSGYRNAVPAANGSGSDAENEAASVTSGSESEKPEKSSFLSSKEDARRIREAMRAKRASSITNNSTTISTSHPNSTNSNTARSRTSSRESLQHRRRSPTATSPPSTSATDGIFSASQARRMVKAEREEALRSVLSPRAASISKSSGPVPVRRSMIEGVGTGTPNQGVGIGAGAGARGPLRQSFVPPGSAGRVGLGLGGKGAWR